MAKLKNIIKQLSDKDYQSIYHSLIESNAEKSAYLLKALRERSISDTRIMTDLEVNTNAYYTLRSRLNVKIEEYLMQQLESPRADVLRKVANINEVVFTKKRTIAIATLKKLEKELIDYDLASELTVVYKSLKKLHVNSPDYFNYSQLYNRHVAYMLALDKAEDLLADYFKKYGSYLLNGDSHEKLGLTLVMREMHNVANLYESHRLYVYRSAMQVFHRLFVEPDENLQHDSESIEDIFNKVQKIFDTYGTDSIYYHINLVFEFLKLEYYNYYNVYRQAEKFYEEVNDATPNLLGNYSNFTFPSQFLISKLNRHMRLGTESELCAENENLFADYEPDPLDIPRHIIYITYRSLSCYYAGRYEDSAKLINQLLNDVSLKKYPIAQLELKSLLALQYVMLHDNDLFNQLANSIQRQIRVFGKNICGNVLLFMKILKIASSEAKREKEKKINLVIPRLQAIKPGYFAPTLMVKMDEKFISSLVGI